ncbi:MAG: NAD(P)/FAD-dependent oxidoreductase [Deltaproteobacteria bacterium]|nr:NAD(P)/FAD-dependent oxidoreductase [Deltaproteobacteria bacterium]MBW2362829.1 NAD(P)/FAD-dependent oxidoreductase [Deltaproteobacteria bacterium]
MSAQKGNRGEGETRQLDAVIIGAGFSGLYALYKLRDVMGMDVQVYETADGVGGAWYWNRYPGSRCDSESYYYCFSFSEELAQEWEWSGKYPEQPEIERYLNHVADRFDLRRDIQFSTRVASARFDDAANCWEVCTEQGERVRARYLISAVGCLSAANLPDIPGRDSFQGEAYHTAAWPREGVDVKGKRVGIIGTGSTGIQATPRIAAEAAHLTVFQRTPNFTVPARHTLFAPEDQAEIKKNYSAIFERTRRSPAGFPYFPIERKTLDVSAEERQQILEELWEEGGFKFLWGGFSDMMTDPAANALVSEFIRNKIRASVNDPETAELLCPTDHPYGSKRPPIDSDYYVSFNRDNVSLVDIRSAPIEAITPMGLRTQDAEYELDVLVFATGFDAMTGALLKIDIQGAGGRKLADAWAEGPRSYLGLQVAGFPNLFTITGPGSPSVLVNMPVSIEHHVDWISDCIERMRERGETRIEATEAAQDAWVEHVAEVSKMTLIGQADSWYVGANIPGKPRVVMPYTGGQPLYRERVEAVVNADYEGFEFRA